MSIFSEHYICTTPGCDCEGLSNKEYIDKILGRSKLSEEGKEKLKKELEKLMSKASN